MSRRTQVTAVLVGFVLAGLPALAAVALAGATAPAVARAAEAGTRATVPDLLVAACGLLGALLLAGLTVDVLVSAVQEAVSPSRPTQRPHRRPEVRVPRHRPVRRVVALAVGLALGSATLSATAAPRTPPAGWATLAPVTPGWPTTVPTTLPAAAPDAGWARHVPEVRPATTAATTPSVAWPGATRAPAADQGAEVVVQRGDTLWSLARAHLGPHVSDTSVATAVDRLYAANAHVVGDDPDLLLPGQVLHLP